VTLSADHEALARLFRDRPELAPEMLRLFGVPLPDYQEARVESADFNQFAPIEFRADLVVLLVDGKPVLGIVIEVQLSEKAEKRLTWPVYVSTLRARMGCPACVLVVAPDAGVARWAAAPIDIGPGARLQPIVLGPSAVPIVVDADAARQEPELAVLSALAHAEDADADLAARIALTAMVACLSLDTEAALFYADVIRNALGPAARVALEALMQDPQHREFQSDFARKYTAIGRAEGKAEGEAKAILRVLDKRGVALTAEQRDRVLACTDIATLEGWLDRALLATAADELFR
jgi:hypothetical protein